MALALAAGLSACAARTANRGNLPTESQIAKIEVGKHNRNQVAKIIGTPSTIGTFDSQVWYYIGRRTEKWGFLEEKVIDQQIVVIYFNKKGVIEHLQRYSKDDIRRIEMVGRVTPTAGHELGVIEQIIGNFGRFNRNRPQK
jgi:outer membrane protein assembly factor BamE (lipoprotein component of BamABCDE complex)|tara:strand:- start:12 stop:434 length:423 start_codon:yes stop_codon:yes gene_type:complete